MGENRLKKLGEELKRLRKNKGLSLKEVGVEVGISHNFLSEVENGKKEPSKETLRRISKFFNIDEDELFDIIDRVPLRAQELFEAQPELQKLLSELERKYGNDKEKMERVSCKIRRVYQDLLNEED